MFVLAMPPSTLCLTVVILVATTLAVNKQQVAAPEVNEAEGPPPLLRRSSSGPNSNDLRSLVKVEVEMDEEGKETKSHKVCIANGQISQGSQWVGLVSQMVRGQLVDEDYNKYIKSEKCGIVLKSEEGEILYGWRVPELNQLGEIRAMFAKKITLHVVEEPASDASHLVFKKLDNPPYWYPHCECSDFKTSLHKFVADQKLGGSNGSDGDGDGEGKAQVQLKGVLVYKEEHRPRNPSTTSLDQELKRVSISTPPPSPSRAAPRPRKSSLKSSRSFNRSDVGGCGVGESAEPSSPPTTPTTVEEGQSPGGGRPKYRRRVSIKFAGVQNGGDGEEEEEDEQGNTRIALDKLVVIPLKELTDAELKNLWFKDDLFIYF